MISEDRLHCLRALCPGAAAKTDMGQDLVYLPDLQFLVAGTLKQMDALLGLTPQGSYLTRLYLSQPIPERPQIKGNAANWTSWMLLGRNWYTWSWQNVPGSLPLIQVLLDHLKAIE